VAAEEELVAAGEAEQQDAESDGEEGGRTEDLVEVEVAAEDPVEVAPEDPVEVTGQGLELEAGYPGRPWVPCTSCDLTFKTKRLLYDHVRSWHGEPADCPECGKAFLSQRAMLRHKEDVHGKPRGLCDFCGRGFTKKASLDRHMKSCKAGLILEPRVVQAVKRRRGAPPRLHVCSQCDFRSTIRTAFQQHRLKEHPEDKIFACGLCDKAFVLRSTLGQHMSRAHRDVTFPCLGEVLDGAVVRPGCGKVFDRHDSMLRHKKICGRPKAPKPYEDLSRWQKARRADGEAAEILARLDQLDPEQRKKVLLRMVKRDPSILDLLDRNPLTMDAIIGVIIL
jgi:uncharacterized C2H2 Zn-finger protein